MEALRRSKASAGEAPNLPPQRGPSLRSFTLRSLVDLTQESIHPSRRRTPGLDHGRISSPSGPQTRSLASGSLLVFRPALPLVDSYGTLYGGESERGMPRAVTYKLSTQGVDELFVVQPQDLFHAETLAQDALDDYGGCPHAYGVTLTRPGEPLYLAVLASLEVDDHRPPALGTAAWNGDVGVFLDAFLVLVARIPGVLDQEREAVIFAIRLLTLRLQTSISLWEPARGCPTRSRSRRSSARPHNRGGNSRRTTCGKSALLSCNRL